MLLVPTVAGALLAHTALGLTLRSDNAAVQVVLSPNDSTTEPPDTWEDVDISRDGPIRASMAVASLTLVAFPCHP